MIKSLILTLVIIAIAISFDFRKFEFNFGYLLYFVDLPSLLLIVIPPVGLTIGNFSWKTYKKTWSIPFGNPENFEQSELIETHKCVNYMGNMFVIMGLVGPLILATQKTLSNQILWDKTTKIIGFSRISYIYQISTIRQYESAYSHHLL